MNTDQDIKDGIEYFQTLRDRTRERHNRDAMKRDAKTARIGLGIAVAVLLLFGLAYLAGASKAGAQVPNEALDGGTVRAEELAFCYQLLAACEGPVLDPPPPPSPIPLPPGPSPFPRCLNEVTAFEVTTGNEVHREQVEHSGRFKFSGSFIYPEGTPLRPDNALRSITTIMGDEAWSEGHVLAYFNVKGRETKLTAKRQHRDDLTPPAAMLKAKPEKGLRIVAGKMYAFEIRVDDETFQATITGPDGSTSTQVGKVPQGPRVTSVNDLEHVVIVIGHADGDGPERAVIGAVYSGLCLESRK